MANGEIYFSVDYADFARRIRATEKQIDDLTTDHKVMRDILDKIQRRQETRWVRNFNSQGAEYGGKWRDIELDTFKGRRNKNAPTLVDSGKSKGELRGFMEDNAFSFGTFGIEWDFTGKGRSGKTGDAFPLPFHHTGYVNYMNNKRVAPREIWDLDSKDEDNAFRVFSQWAHKAISGFDIFS